jgi:mannose-6-phosphate isomerase-like protein (cupin superfamily)
MCVNRASYAEQGQGGQPFALWPEPVGGYRLHVYEWDRVPRSEFIHSRNIAVQWNPYRDAQRGEIGTPHYHDDFEHTLFCVSGEYVYHMRYPWGTDPSAWRADEHVPVKTPALAVVPPLVTHVAEAVGTRNSMIDISAPPRPDLLLRLASYAENAAEYPLPRPGPS